LGRYYRKRYRNYGYYRNSSYHPNPAPSPGPSAVSSPVPASAVQPSAPALNESQGWEGIDKDVLELFIRLDDAVLTQVFRAYKAAHGEKKAEYVRRVYRQWKSGDVRMSGELSQRFLALVPRFLSFEQKYKLIENLWRHCRKGQILRIAVSSPNDVSTAIEAVSRAIELAYQQELPPRIRDRLVLQRQVVLD
jgi:hypothetical protein